MYERESLIIDFCDLLERMGLPSEALSFILNECLYRQGVDNDHTWDDMRDSFRYAIMPGDNDDR